ncbi:hypothetical protein KJ841_02195 [Patescibacteria group bacterium]|nr:hypothetical protein [Patescibacteria group bacterium]
MIIKERINKTKKFLGKVPLIITMHAFWACLILFILSLAIGANLFYKYSILAQRAEPEGLEQTILFKERTYQKVLEIWQEREKRFQEADFKEYSNPFLESVPFPEE